MGPINILHLVSFLDLLAVGLTYPLFSTHLKDLGASKFTIGILSSTYAGIQVLAGPIIGSWSDVRDRKSVLQITVILCAILYGLLGIPKSIIGIFLIRFCLGMCKHTQTLTKAIITDVITPKERSAAFGKSTAWGNLGFIIGPLIGGYLSEYPNGFMYVCLITSGLFILNLGITVNLPEEPTKKHKYDSLLTGIKTEFKKSLRELIEVDWKAHWVSFLLRFLFGLCSSAYFSNQVLYLKEKHGLSQKHIGYTISIYSSIGMIVALYLEKINSFYKNDRTGYQQLFHFFAIFALSFYFIYVSPNLFTYMLCLIPLAISSIVIRVISMDLLMKESNGVKRGSLSGASNSIMSIARFVSPLFSGIMVDFFGQSVILMSVLPATLGMGLSWYFNLKRKIH
ncbi:unnamed protein product [Brassicogethes aeneus]|uniref:Major facilitator superfamily (MFS) profile domain-containing protein n=1 Tax=Brassicogethes aeneus TaxID=1431903 RepID=A0A9P0BC91_BRAAE|nr:unnamed protein product [Brassicogethes aeneus]